MMENPKVKSLEGEREVASSRLRMGMLMMIAGLAISAVSVFSVAMVVGLMAGPPIFLLGIIVAGHSLQRLVRIKKEATKKI